MSNLAVTKKRVIFLFFMIIIGSIFSLLWFIMNGNADQMYADITVGYPSIFSGNKSAECNILFGLIFLGLIVYGIFFFFTNKSETLNFTCPYTDKQKSKEFLCALAAIAVVYLVIYNSTYQIVIVSLIYALILCVIDLDLVYIGICTFYLGVYSCIGVFRLYVFLGGEKYTNNMTLALVSIIISLFPLIFNDKKKALIRTAMLEAIMVPCGLLIFLANRYMYGDKLVIINPPNILRYTVFAVILIGIAEAVYVLLKKWNYLEKIDNVITIGSCVTIMAFNRFDGTGAIMPVDVHHPFENVIGYSQVFDLGQSLFKEYIPVSGMYSIFQGAVFKWFGQGGTFANYNITNNFFYLLMIILLVILLRAQLDGSYVLLIALVFFVRTYNRAVFILPIMLLLMWPNLVKKKNSWLIAWFITSLFHGLYYPLYGVATCVAFLPLGIYQVITFVKSKDFKRELRKKRFWISWGICVVLMFASMRYLLGTLKHMLAMSGQSILVDGITVFGQIIPGWFFSYLSNNHPALRIALYYILVVMIPVAFVWIAFAITLKLGNISFINKRITIGDAEKGCIAASAVIMPVICYTFSFIRIDINSIYARSSVILYAGLAIILVIAWQYIRIERLRILIICIMVSIPAVINNEGIFSTESNSKLTSYYTVPEGYIYVENDPVEKMGTGFVSQDRYDAIMQVYERFDGKDREQSYMGDPAWFGYYYLFDIKGDGPMEIASTVKGYSAAKEVIDIARENKSILSTTFTPYQSYYLYHWLLASGEYYWDVAAREFIPNDGLYSREEILEQNKDIGIVQNGIDIGKTAGSWGLSMDSLEAIFTEYKSQMILQPEGNGLAVIFSEGVDGDTADFLYLEFKDMMSAFEYTLYNLSGEVSQRADGIERYLMKKNYNPDMTVQIRWDDDNGEDHTMNCKMCKGKLLIPLGAGAKWLFNHHQSISIYVYKDGIEIPVPVVSKVRMLKVREIE